MEVLHLLLSFSLCSLTSSSEFESDFASSSEMNPIEMPCARPMMIDDEQALPVNFVGLGIGKST